MTGLDHVVPASKKLLAGIQFSSFISRLLALSWIPAFAGTTMFCFMVQATEVKKVEAEGLSAYFVEDHSVPVFTLKLAFKHGGTAYDTPKKEGLAYLASRLVQEGAGEYNALAFSQALEKKAISLNFYPMQDTMGVVLESLSENRARAVELLQLALTKPRFEKDDVVRVQDETQSVLKRLSENPGYIAEVEWHRLAYPGHAYGRPARGTPESIARVGQEDLRAFVKERFTRQDAIVAAAGDLTEADLKAILTQLAKAMPEKGEINELSEVSVAGSGTTVIKREIPQSVVAFGYQGIKRDDPRYYAAYLLNEYLGGGDLTTRLMRELRQERGLVYGVSMGLDPMPHGAVWKGTLASSNETTTEAVKWLTQTLERVAETGMEDKDLTEAKSYVTGSFPLNLDSNGSLADYLIAMQYYELGIDYLDKRNDIMRAVTVEDVKALAKSLLGGKKPLIVMVGNPKEPAKTP